MTRNRVLFFVLSAALVLPICFAAFLAAADRQEAGEDSFFKYLSVFTQVLSLVRGNYVEPTESDPLLSGAFDGATDALDPFSLYVPPEALEPYLEARRVGTRHSGLLVLRERGVVYAATVQEGSPADEAGVRLADIIAEIDGTETRTMPLWEVQQILAGQDRQVNLELLRLGDRVAVTLELGPFDPPAVRLREKQGVGVLRIPAFGPGTPLQVRSALAQAATAGWDRLLIDLRGVGEGDAAAAYEVAGLFARGELGTLKRRSETVESFTGAATPAWEGRIVVLVDRGTLGPAELLATVLRQAAGAELVGQRTFGYAGRQDLTPLSTGGRLVYTSAFYTGPDGEALRESLVPDVRVDERSRSLAETDEPLEDLILERGLSVLKEEGEASDRDVAAAGASGGDDLPFDPDEIPVLRAA